MKQKHSNLITLIIAATLLLIQTDRAFSGKINLEDFQPRWKIVQGWLEPGRKTINLSPRPCNYIYVSQNDEVIYYGTSKSCNNRIDTHSRAINYMSVFLGYLKRQDGYENIIKVVKGFVDQGNQLQSDVCLSIWTIAKSSESYKILYYDGFNNGPSARQAETCVLSKIAGFCNVKKPKNFNTQFSADRAKTVLDECVR